MSIYSIEPPPPRNRSAEILTISVLVAILLLLAIGAVLWFVRGDLVLAPTPTPTQTSRPTTEATTDVRATMIVEDVLTQEAFKVALERQALATTSAALGTAEVIVATQQAQLQTQATRLNLLASPPPTVAPVQLNPTATSPLQFLPISTLTGMPTSQPATATMTPTPAPIAVVPTPVATQTGDTIISLPVVVSETMPTPTTTPTDQTPPTATATAPQTPTVSPTATPSLTPTNSPTPSRYVVGSLNAVIRDAETDIRIGPSNSYSVTATFNRNEQINLLGRTASGEWILTCCRDNEPGWVRQAYITPVDNTLGSGAPEDAEPNDVRWLRVEPIPSDLDPLPNPTTVPMQDYPLLRRDVHNRARPANLPRPPISQFWPYQASQPFTSPVVVAGNEVLAVSADRHIYSIDRTGGNQRWRLALLEEVSTAPAVQDNLIYIVDDDGHTYAIEDRSNSAQIIWQGEIFSSPYSGPIVVENHLFLVGPNDRNLPALLVINRDNGDLVRSHVVTVNVSSPQHPTIGDQLVYVGAEQIWALDVNVNDDNDNDNDNDSEVVWQNTDVRDVNAPLVYIQPGDQGLAELYAGTVDGDVFSLDANTGKQIWRYEHTEEVSGLAADDERVYASGKGYVKAIDRENGEERWRAAVDGEVRGGPIVDGSQVLVVTETGSIQFLDPNSGAPVGGANIPAKIVGAPAVSGPWLYVASDDSTLYAFRENP